MTLPQSTSPSSTRTYTIYLIRHGEALHNVEEKRVAKQVIADAAAAEGLGPEDPVTLERILVARQAILTDERFFDAPLTAKGEEDALLAHELIKELTTSEEGETSSLPVPQEVFVSPLRRALRTADLIFPGESTPIHVYEQLRERLTGRPADNRFASDVLAKGFKRFDFHPLRLNSFTKSISPLINNSNSLPPATRGERGQHVRHSSCAPSSDIEGEDDEELLEDIFQLGPTISSQNDSEPIGRTPRACAQSTTALSTLASPRACAQSTTALSTLASSHAAAPRPPKQRKSKTSACNTDTVLEDNEKLQERAVKLFDLLAKSQCDTVAIVTHKGFLRELEHGVFGLPETKEFKNCEVRVYRATFEMTETSMLLQDIERLK